MLIFQTNVTVPKHIISQIGVMIKTNIINHMRQERQAYDAFKESDISKMASTIDKSIIAIINSEGKSCDGWTLNKNQLEEIALSLSRGEKVDATRKFRQYTGTGLKDAHAFISKFGLGDRASMEFTNAFV